MSTRALHEDVRVLEVPISYEERVGRSKLSVMRDGARFLKTIIWTAMTYNPVRIFGLFGLGGVGMAFVVGLSLLALRLQGVTTLGPTGTYAVFGAVVFGAAGTSLFVLGASFNYLVSLFHRRPIRQGLFRKPLFRVPIERLFLPMGALAIVAGVVISVISLLLSYRGWSMDRLWLYLAGSAMLIIIGIQLASSWLEMSILRELSERQAPKGK
jgi:hypothetical protein